MMIGFRGDPGRPSHDDDGCSVFPSSSLTRSVGLFCVVLLFPFAVGKKSGNGAMVLYSERNKIRLQNMKGQVVRV